MYKKKCANNNQNVVILSTARTKKFSTFRLNNQFPFKLNPRFKFD